jgi:polysaccharide biosynthesis protein VpsQ
VNPEPSRASNRTVRFRWIAAGVWLVAIAFIVYCADRRLMRPMFAFITAHPGLDKVGHFVLVGGSAFLLNLAFGLRQWKALGRSWLLGSTLIAAAVTIEEFTQLWFPSRSFDLLDLAADFAGIVCFGWLARRLFGQTKQV